jgi:hypothetical protein
METTASRVAGVWVYTTSAAFNRRRAGGYLSFLSDAEADRLERIRQARLLFDGCHREYFLEEERTQFDFPPVRAGSRTFKLYLTYNVLGLISLKTADLLFGEEPLIRSEDAGRQAAIADLVERSNLHRLLYGAAVDASYEGECFLESCVHDGEAYVVQLPADEVFPVGEVLPSGQYRAYVRYRVHNAGTEGAPVLLLLETMYGPGAITRRCYQLDPERATRRPLALSEWTRSTGEEVEPSTPTGVVSCTVTWIPNLLVRGRAVSDYDGALDLQDALNAKNSQVGRALMKHADPRVAFPEEAFDESGNIRSDYEAYPFSDPEKIPKYITWNAELTSAMADRAFVLNQLLVRTETSPVLLGLKEGAAPDAYKKVRLEAFNSLTKAARKSAYWRAGVRRAVAVALELENTLPGARVPDGSIAVQLRDGIPVDVNAEAARLAILRRAGLISLARAIEEQLQDPAAVEKELGRLEQEPTDEGQQGQASDPLGDPLANSGGYDAGN